MKRSVRALLCWLINSVEKEKPGLYFQISIENQPFLTKS